MLGGAGEVRLLADRKGTSTRPRTAWETYVLRVHRKAVETAFGEIEALSPRSIHAGAGRGFDWKRTPQKGALGYALELARAGRWRCRRGLWKTGRPVPRRAGWVRVYVR